MLSAGNALASTGEGWGTAIEVPGTAVLNAGGIAQMNSMSCASSGNCLAGGWYTDASHDRRAFVADETGGVWGNAIAVPDAATLGSGASDQVSSVSCAPRAAGDCSVGGLYLDTSNHWQEFVADETSGVWGQAKPLSANPSLVFNELDSLSCTSAGNCSAAGTERAPSFTQLWVADEKNGKWAPTTEMPGLAALNAGGSARVSSLSCNSSGNCAATGFYANASDDLLPFVINETGGVWGQAAEVPGIASLTKGVAQATKTTLAEPNSVSCSSTGNCALGGYYVSFIGVSRSNFQAFVAEEVNGVWLHALPVPGTSALNTGKQAMVNTVSCPRAGTCALGGTYAVTTKGNTQVFVDNRG